jgi:hypothetical protein
MLNKKFFLVTGIIVALLIAFVPFLAIYITSGYWITTNAFGIEGVARVLIFTASFILSLLVIWYTFYLYFKE